MPKSTPVTILLKSFGEEQIALLDSHGHRLPEYRNTSIRSSGDELESSSVSPMKPPVSVWFRRSLWKSARSGSQDAPISLLRNSLDNLCDAIGGRLSLGCHCRVAGGSAAPVKGRRSRLAVALDRGELSLILSQGCQGDAA
jgi:hypothetical protein